jgi:hypothetical protein
MIVSSGRLFPQRRCSSKVTPAASSQQMSLSPEPGQGEDCLLPAGQRAGPVAGADLPAVIGQQPREERGQLDGHVEHDTIRQHAGPSR